MRLLKNNKMKQLIATSLLLLVGNFSFGQMIMTTEGVTAKNVCQPNTVYFLTGMKKEKRAKPVESIEAIQQKLNSEVSFARDNPDFSGKASIQFAVNCKGEVGGGFHVVIKSGEEKFDEALINFFKSITDWNPGMRKKNKPVDSWYMWRVEIKDRYISILN